MEEYGKKHFRKTIKTKRTAIKTLVVSIVYMLLMVGYIIFLAVHRKRDIFSKYFMIIFILATITAVVFAISGTLRHFRKNHYKDVEGILYLISVFLPFLLLIPASAYELKLVLNEEKEILNYWKEQNFTPDFLLYRQKTKDTFPKDIYDEYHVEERIEYKKEQIKQEIQGISETESKYEIVGEEKYKALVDDKGREVLLDVRGADVFFHVGHRTVKACNNLNFKVYRGETFGLVGESGSGKTTITRAILRINKLTNGAIYFQGKKISGKISRKERIHVKKNIQMIFQDPSASLNERANVDYIISEGLYNFKLYKNKKDRLEKVLKMLERVSLLPEHLSRYPHEFSGGQRQRIGIARALVVEPKLVLADEPISALDVSIRAQVLNLLKELQEERNLTYIFIAHDLSIIKYISDRIAVMHEGHIVELGEAETIYQHPYHPYTKSLLTAIPQPDPNFSKNRQKIIYDKGDMDYSKCEWIQIEKDHYILATDELLEKWGASRYKGENEQQNKR